MTSKETAKKVNESEIKISLKKVFKRAFGRA
jgi:hypothetical protein